MCVNILSSVIKKQTNLVDLETPCRLHTHTHTHTLTDTLMGVGIFPSPQSEPVVEGFGAAEPDCVYLLYEGLYNCKKEFREQRKGESKCASHASFHY